MTLDIDDRIIDICTKSLGIKKEILQNLYAHIFKGSIPGKAEELVLDKKEFYPKGIDQTEHFMLTGIDLPLWIKSNSPVDNRIMLIGAEPLRNWDSFKDEGRPHRYNDILINTPYSIHQPDAEQTVYGKIIQCLAQNNDVYLTDYRKIWFAGFEHHKSFLSSSTHIEFILAEIDAFKPHLIFTFGKNGLRQIEDVGNKLNIPVHYLIHPSRRTLGKMRNDFFEDRNISIEQYSSIKNSNERNAMPFVEYIQNSVQNKK
jgi:hypothetical protein